MAKSRNNPSEPWLAISLIVAPQIRMRRQGKFSHLECFNLKEAEIESDGRIHRAIITVSIGEYLTAHEKRIRNGKALSENR
jgi:hypothetical protein